METAGYTEEQELIITDRYNDLIDSCKKIAKTDEEWELIRKAFFLAKEAHKGVLRRSGEPYILHPIAVAKIVVEEIGLGSKSVAAALLHDVVEDTDYTVEEIEAIFGEKVAYMVDGLTKMAGVVNTDTSKQAAYFRKVLLTLSDDVRVILIKIADRLHNMRTMASMPRNKQIKISSETLYLFAPLAYRLGLYSIKTELEDLSLKYRYPEQYNEIAQKLNETEAARTAFIDRFIAPIRKQLTDSGIDFTISGRIKSIFSIWSKMQRKNIPFEDVYDLFAAHANWSKLTLKVGTSTGIGNVETGSSVTFDGNTVYASQPVYSVGVYSMSGALVRNSEVVEGSWSVADIPSGVYVLTYTQNGTKKSVKIIKR